jgi:hypothetical protein
MFQLEISKINYTLSLYQSSDTKIQFNIHTLNKEMVDKIHSQNKIFLIGITHRSTCEQFLT